MKRAIISAYACEPNVGSEPGVGWNWVLKTARSYDEVHVVTRSGDRQIGADGIKYVRDSRKHIEQESAALGLNKHVHFHYFDLPAFIANRERSTAGDIINIYLWEVLVFFFLRKKFRKNEFDFGQKVTIVSHRYPSFLWFFTRSYTHGPIAGGERFPARMLGLFSVKNRIKEILRNLFQYTPMFDPLLWLTYSKADQIIAVTEQSRTILPPSFRPKCLVQQAVDVEENFEENTSIPSPVLTHGEPLKLLFVGRLLEWKGLMLALNAVQQLPIPYEFQIVGDGPDAGFMKAFASEHQLNVTFSGFVPRNTLPEVYQSSHLFLFPSLRDSGGFVVLEAQANGLPALTLNLGGPPINLDKQTGMLVEVNGKSVNDITTDIARKIESYYAAITEKSRNKNYMHE